MENRRVQFFNAGDRIQATMYFSDPGGHDIHCICYFALDAPMEGFFTVPEESRVGDAIIRSTFDRDIMRDYGNRGVIRVDANYKPPMVQETYYDRDDRDQEFPRSRDTDQINHEADDLNPIAATEKLAQEKGARIWKAWCQKRVTEFMEQCENIRLVGGVPRPASGAVLRYLKVCGMVDPSAAMLREAQKQATVTEELQGQVKDLQDKLNRLLDGQSDQKEPAKELEMAGAGKGAGKGKGQRA